MKALSYYVSLVENLINGKSDEVYGTRLKFYHDTSLHKGAILSHVLTSGTGMQVTRLLHLVDGSDSLRVAIR